MANLYTGCTLYSVVQLGPKPILPTPELRPKWIIDNPGLEQKNCGSDANSPKEGSQLTKIIGNLSKSSLGESATPARFRLVSSPILSIPQDRSKKSGKPSFIDTNNIIEFEDWVSFEIFHVSLIWLISDNVRSLLKVF